ncbi:O-antigen polymerase [Nocardioides zeae]|uniref:Oligosaccharide repeat unit polymerase n=1 Tax=Nocardioides zeae TaxID=1457234 RepID=A0A6P0HMW2_9ACTN|nr:O-antigen polymerase [Nocardioides zeae]NEN79971.1 oligosaccharide repeat unit polymerase [Nocardioides zeae]
MRRTQGLPAAWAALFLAASALSAAALFVVETLPRLSDGEVGVLTAIVFVVISVLFVAFTSAKPIRPLSLFTLIAVGQTVLFVARPAYSLRFQGGRNLFTGTEYDGSFVTAQLTAGVAFLAFSVAYGLSSRVEVRGPSRAILPIPEAGWRRVRPLVVVVALVGTGLYSLHIASIGLGNYLAVSTAGRDRELQAEVGTSSGYFYSGLMIATGAIVLLFIQAAASGERRRAVRAAFFLAALALPSLLSGTRSQFLPIILALAIVWIYLTPRRNTWRRFALFAPILLVVGFVAPRIWRNSTDDSVGWVSALGAAFSPKEIFETSLGSLDTAMVDAFSLQVARQSSGALEQTYGSSYLGLLAAPIPRAIWPSKPLPTDQLLNADVFPATAERGIGFSFSMYSEPYLNFGWLGTIGVFLIFGFFLGRLSSRLETSRTVPWLFVYALTSGFTFALVRGTFTYNFQRLLIPLVPALLALLFSVGLKPAHARGRPPRPTSSGNLGASPSRDRRLATSPLIEAAPEHPRGPGEDRRTGDSDDLSVKGLRANE